MILLIPAAAPAQNYLWPTKASTALTSTFAEFRPGHFHSGIDIKTWNRSGYRVYAISNGYISRIRVSRFGYGKVIYHKLNDGNTAVYAHLDRFSKDLNDVARGLQEESGKYRVDKYFLPEEFPEYSRIT